MKKLFRSAGTTGYNYELITGQAGFQAGFQAQLGWEALPWLLTRRLRRRTLERLCASHLSLFACLPLTVDSWQLTVDMCQQA